MKLQHSLFALSVLVASIQAATADTAQRSPVSLLRTAQGSTEVLVDNGRSVSRIVGFGFDARDEVHVQQLDVDDDGDLDLMVTNRRPQTVSYRAPGPEAAEAALMTLPAAGRAATYVIVTPKEGLAPVLDVSDEPAVPNHPPGVSGTKLGDNDNFGYGLGNGAPPCEFFDRRGPGDLGIFDYETATGEDEVQVFTHTFKVRGTPTALRFVTWEIFSEDSRSRIDFDGHTMRFAMTPFAVCGAYGEGGFKRVFVLSGRDAAIAADGSVTVTVRENGDDIALDRSKLKVEFE